MDLIPVKTPRILKKLFPNYIWSLSTSEKVIYLTFDDGPTPDITDWTLATLSQFNAKATFFCIGNNIDKHPDIFKNIIKAGHAVGNHTYNHTRGWKTKTKDYLNGVERAQKAINTYIESSKTEHQQSLAKDKLFRPPYGKIKIKQGKKLLEKGYKVIMWDVIAFDWSKKITPHTCLKNVLDHTSNGSIVVFHDSLKASKNMKFALPKVLEHFTKRGYSFKTLDGQSI